MKKLMLCLGISLVASSVSFAGTVQPMEALSLMGNLSLRALATDNLGWKVGDNYEMGVKVSGMQLGTLKASVTKDEGDSLWMEQDMDLMIQKQKVEIQMSKEDAHIIKYIVNGKEQTPPSQDDMQVISQEYTNVTVPAGTFTAIHEVVKTPQVDKLEVWVNAADTVMDGTLKVITSQQGMDLTMEMTKFHKEPRQ